MGEEHLRLLLEDGGDDERRDVLLHGGERLEHVAAHVEVDAADRQQHAVVGLRPARHDGDVEVVLGVGAVGDGLVVAAVLGLGDPVGPEAHRVPLLGERLAGAADARRDGKDCRQTRQMFMIRLRCPPIFGRAEPGSARTPGAWQASCRARPCATPLRRRGAPLSFGPMRRHTPPTVRPPFARYSHAVEVPPGARLLVRLGPARHRAGRPRAGGGGGSGRPLLPGHRRDPGRAPAWASPTSCASTPS